MRRTFPFASVLMACLLAQPGQSSADLISDALSGMPANSWQKLNINAIQSVFTPLAQRPTTASPSSNIYAWSGAAWDRGRSRLYIWGGDDYPGGEEGNEVYIFSGKTGLWSRGSLPSQITSTNGIEHTVDGVMNAPLSGESWDNVVFLNNVNRMAVIGVSKEGKSWRDPSTGLFTGPYFWDPTKADPDKVSGLTGSHVNPSGFPDVVGGQMWQNRDRPMGVTSNHLQGTTAYVDVDGKDVVYVTDSRDNLWRYTVHDLDPANDTWEQVGRRPITGVNGWGAATIDTTNNLYLKTLTATSFGFWDLDRPDDPAQNREIQVRPSVEADTIAPDFRDFGLQFDPTLGAFMLWDGSGSVWKLTPPDDLDSDDDGFLDVATGWLLEEIDVSGPGPSIPSAYTGVYGKWLYLEEYNAYLGVIDGLSGDVFLYKSSASAPVPVPEPSIVALLLVGLLGILASSRANQRRA
jgi:hypothetical protein